MENPRAGQMRPGGLGAGKGRAVTRRPRPEKRPIFALKIQGQTGPAGIHALRKILKVLLRRYDFVCLDAREIGGRR
jgi:hypothetical protein